MTETMSAGAAHPTRESAQEHAAEPSPRAGRWDWSGVAIALLLYAVSRALAALFIVVEARHQTPMAEVPPGYHSAVPYGTPSGYTDVVTNWDGQWYWDIVLHGYPSSAVDAAGEPLQTSLAFYPLYPTVVRALTGVTGLGFEVVAPTLSLVLGAAAVVVLFRLLTDVVGRTRALLGVALLTSFVSAPVLQTAYTESLALLLVASALLLLRRRSYLWALVPVLLLGLTRNITLVLAPVIVLHWVAAWRADRDRVRHGRLALLLSAAVLATLEWPVLAGLLTGESDAYLTTMKAWPGYTSSVLYPPWLRLVVDSGPAGWLIGVLFVVLAVTLMLRPAQRAWGPELWGWAAAYPAYIVAGSGVALSFLRYLLLAFPFVLVIASPAATASQRRSRLVVVVAVCLLGLLAQWWWVGHALVVRLSPDGYNFP